MKCPECKTEMCHNNGYIEVPDDDFRECVNIEVVAFYCFKCGETILKNK